MTEARPASSVGVCQAGGRDGGHLVVCSSSPPGEWSVTWRGEPSGRSWEADPWAGEGRPSDNWRGSWPGAPRDP